MKIFKNRIFVSILMLCWLYPNTSSAQATEKKEHLGWGFSCGLGYSHLIATGNFYNYMKGGMGLQFDINALYKRFEFNFSLNGHFTKVKKDFILNNNPMSKNDIILTSTLGLLASYAIVYNDYLKISPHAGISWCELAPNDENLSPKSLFTPAIGLLIQYNSMVTSLGGLTNGFCAPYYLKYNYCFPRKYTTDINSGMHIISIGFKLLYKDRDK